MRRFFVGRGPEPGPVVLDRSRVYILPTAQGIVLGLLILAMVTGSLNFNNSLGLLLSFLLAGLSFVAILHTWSNLAGLTFQVSRVEPVFAGETARALLHAGNPLRRPRWAVRLRHARDSGFRADDVPADGITFELSLPTLRRGRLPLGRLVVESRFPLGLFRAWAHLEFAQMCTVYPRPGPPCPFPEARGEEGVHSGSHGFGDEEFCDLRPYTPGDAPRTLHWKASARTDRLLVKRTEGGASGILYLDWDSLGEPDHEKRLSQLCRWILEAHRAGRSWELRLPGAEFSPEGSVEHLHRCLSALALFEAE